MGVKNLWEILESCKKTLPLHHLQNKRVCIDLSCWMVQLHNVNKSHCAMKDKLYLKGLFHRIRALIALNCSVILVTDGSIPGIKVSTYRRRLHLDNEETQDESSSNKNTSLQRNMGSEFSCMIKEAKILASTLGVPCLDGIEEGEAQCALLDSESLCDGCFSSDSDIFLFGARTVYRDICLGEGGYVVCYEMDDIEKKLGFGRNSLIALAVLLGCDYSPGVRGIGPDLACQIVRSFGESAVLQRLASQELLLKKKAKCSKKQNQVSGFNNKENIPPQDSNIIGHKSNLPTNHQFQQVMDAYLKPKCHSADSQMVQRVLGMHPFQRTRLLQTCHRFFEWPPEKTDEYILPKIAERDLRRFANLRCTSSDLGVRLPLDKMPVKCPVSGIIKRRKAQGKECFEVSWEDMDGLSSSIVPAELVHSACPEKIVEFEQMIAEKKRPKPRKPKKTETNKSLSEVEAKLQELLLEIEGTSSSGQNYRLIDEPMVNTKSNIEEVKGTCSSGQNYRLIDESLVNTKSNIEEVKGTCSSGQNYRLIDEPLVNTRSNIKEVKGTFTSGQNYRLIDEPLVNTRSNIKEVKGTCSSGQNYRLIDETLVNTRSNIKEVKGTCSSGQNYRLIDESPVNTRSNIKEVKGTCSSGQNSRLIDEPLVNTRSNIVELKGTFSSGQNSKNYRLIDEPLVNMRSNIEEVKVTENRSCDIETEVVNLSTPLVTKTNRKVETQVVDLVSPFSVACPSKNVIDLSESETEVSPEHAKKARELRLFVAKIRDDIS
ncbi:putative spleen exonuclease [Helianthus anomalus]